MMTLYNWNLSMSEPSQEVLLVVDGKLGCNAICEEARSEALEKTHADEEDEGSRGQPQSLVPCKAILAGSSQILILARFLTILHSHTSIPDTTVSCTSRIPGLSPTLLGRGENEPEQHGESSDLGDGSEVVAGDVASDGLEEVASVEENEGVPLHRAHQTQAQGLQDGVGSIPDPEIRRQSHGRARRDLRETLFWSWHGSIS